MCHDRTGSVGGTARALGIDGVVAAVGWITLCHQLSAPCEFCWHLFVHSLTSDQTSRPPGVGSMERVGMGFTVTLTLLATCLAAYQLAARQSNV